MNEWAFIKIHRTNINYVYDHIVFFNNAAIFSERAAVSSLIVRLSTHRVIYVNEEITAFAVHS